MTSHWWTRIKVSAEAVFVVQITQSDGVFKSKFLNKKKQNYGNYKNSTLDVSSSVQASNKFSLSFNSTCQSLVPAKILDCPQ